MKKSIKVDYLTYQNKVLLNFLSSKMALAYLKVLDIFVFTTASVYLLFYRIEVTTTKEG